MKKKLIAFMTITAILASGVSVFADEAADNVSTEIQGDIMPISEDGFEEITVTPSYISKDVTVTEITEEKISTTLNGEDAENPENIVNYTILEETLVFNSKGEKKSVEDIKENANITVFTSSYSPAPLILPPQYQADVVIIREDEESFLDFINVDTYFADGEMLVNAANTLALNISEDTEIIDLEENEVDADKLENNDLIVFYGASTRSIPAQTTPEKIVVLGENAFVQIEASDEENVSLPEETLSPDDASESDDIFVDYSKIKFVNAEEEAITGIYLKDDEILMLPLRKIAETLGFTVEWDAENETVILNGGIYSLKIGENSYIKGKMVPHALSTAPEIKDDLTYVPFEYFIEILETYVVLDIEDDVYTLNLYNTNDASTEISE